MTLTSILARSRKPNTTTTGQPFHSVTVEAVWQKGQVTAGLNPQLWRQDAYGALISRSAYGTTTEYGWEIDHIVPVAKDGSDALFNLQPLQWRNNRRKGDDYPGTGR